MPAPPRLALSAGLVAGTQGFAYADWVGPFFPPGTRSGDYLAAYAARLSAVEVDATFYAEPRPATVASWRQRTPPGFVFAAKFPRTVTHDAPLTSAAVLEEARRFVETMRGLGEKLGPLLLQFPPAFGPSQLPALDRFLAALPRDARYVVEVRDARWLAGETASAFLECLTRHQTALALIDHPLMPRTALATTDFAYVRLLGDRALVERFDRIALDRTEDLDAWALIVARFLERHLLTFVFANNHFAGHSPATVAALAERLVRLAQR